MVWHLSRQKIQFKIKVIICGPKKPEKMQGPFHRSKFVGEPKLHESMMEMFGFTATIPAKSPWNT